MYQFLPNFQGVETENNCFSFLSQEFSFVYKKHLLQYFNFFTQSRTQNRKIFLVYLAILLPSFRFCFLLLPQFTWVEPSGATAIVLYVN